MAVFKEQAMSSKGHKITVADWMWEWAIANDPHKRATGAPYLKEVLNEAVVRLQWLETNTAPQIVPTLVPTPVLAPEPEPEPEPPAPPKPPLPRLCPLTQRPWLAQQVRRKSSSRHYGDCWTLSLQQVQSYDLLDRGVRAVRLDLLENTSEVVKYRFVYRQVRWLPDCFELLESAEKGKTMWLIRADRLAAAGLNLLEDYAE
jgi:hypothetical protein